MTPPRGAAARSWPYAKDHAVLVVRRQGRGSDGVLYLRLREFEGHQRHALWRRGARAEGGGDVRDVPASWPAIHRPERRPALHVLAGHIVFRELQDRSGGGGVVGGGVRRAR